VLATEGPKIRRGVPPPRNAGSGAGRSRSSPVWGLVEAARARPGVWLVVDLPKSQSSATGSIHAVRQTLADAGRYEFTTRKRGEKVTAVYCRFNAGGKS
jgi:hypothetical protein